jgi:hypothetical protein
MPNLRKNISLAMILGLLLAMGVVAQDTNTKVMLNSDGSYSVIEYPVGKEVTVRLMPKSGITSTGMAHVMRSANGTKVWFDLTGAPSDWTRVYAYTVDPAGSATLLGPINFTGGMGKAEFMTPGDRFMLVLSPDQGMTRYEPSGTYVFRSEVPSGFTVVPRSGATSVTTTTNSDSMAITTMTTTTPSTYNVPMLGIANYQGKKSDLHLNFGGELSGLEAHAYLKPVSGKTQIRMTFDDLQKAPMNKRFVLWTSGPNGYTKIGQIVHTGNKDTAEIRGETALSDFGLFLTMEDTDVDRPTSTIYSTFTFTPAQ